MSDADEENKRMTMTISKETEEWLRDQYPEALELTEAIRMSISDARKLAKLRNRVEHAEYSDE